MVASPSSVDLPQFDVDADVLARSPVGSVTDLSTCVQSDVEESVDKNDASATVGADASSADDVQQNGEATSSEVNIVVTSPRGTDAVVTEDLKQVDDNQEEDEEKAAPEKPDPSTPTEDKGESSEFVNSQGVTFKPTAETVDDAG